MNVYINKDWHPSAKLEIRDFERVANELLRQQIKGRGDLQDFLNKFSTLISFEYDARFRLSNTPEEEKRQTFADMLDIEIKLTRRLNSLVEKLKIES